MNFRTRWMMVPILFIGTLAGMELEKILNAIQEDNVEKLNTLLTNPEYKSPLATLLEVPNFIGEAVDPSNASPLPPVQIDLLQGAIRNIRPACVQLIATLQGTMKQQEIDKLTSEGKGEEDALAFANGKYIPVPYLSTLYTLTLYSPYMRFALTCILIDNKLAFPNDIVWMEEWEWEPCVFIRTPLSFVHTVKAAEYLIEKGAFLQFHSSLRKQQHLDIKNDSARLTDDAFIFSPFNDCIENENIETIEKEKILLFLLTKGASTNIQTFIRACNAEMYNVARALTDHIGFDALFSSNSSNLAEEEGKENLLEKACDENVRVDNFVKAYPRLALFSNTLFINPFKYKNLGRVDIFNLKNNFPNRIRKSTVNRNVYTAVKVTNLLGSQEVTGKKHSYRYKKDQSLQKNTDTTLNVHYSWPIGLV